MLPTVALTFLVTISGAHGDPAAAKSRALYAEAQQTYDRGEIARALELYLQAYDAKPLPGFLFNIAQCHRQLRNYERAGFYFKRYLELAPKTPNAEVVRDLIVEVDAKQAQLEEEKHKEAEAARAQEVELARIAASQAESDAIAHRAEESRQQEARLLEAATARALTEKPVVQQSSGSILTRWWLWAGVGVVVAGVAAGAVYAGTAPSPHPTTLGTDSAR